MKESKHKKVSELDKTLVYDAVVPTGDATRRTKQLNRLQTTLKNVVMRKIVHIKELKSQKTIKEKIVEYMKGLE